MEKEETVNQHDNIARSRPKLNNKLKHILHTSHTLFNKHRKNIAVVFIVALITTVTSLTIVFTPGFTTQQIMVSPLTNQMNSKNSQNNFILPSNADDVKTLGVLLLGSGGAGHQGGHLTDAMQLLYIDFENSKVSLISIPRDIWIKLPNGQSNKINAAFHVDKNFTKQEISNITGLPVNYFIAIDFVGFTRTIGYELDSIDVEVSQTLDDPWYPTTGEELNTCGLSAEEVHELSLSFSGFELERQFPCRYEHLYFEQGIVHMDGGKAMKYVRSRHGSSEGDVARGKRQQEVLVAMKNKLLTLKTLDNIPALYQQFSTHVQTDIGLDIAQYLTPLLLNSKNYQFIAINLSPTNVLSASTSNTGASILVSKEGNDIWKSTHQFIQETLKGN